MSVPNQVLRLNSLALLFLSVLYLVCVPQTQNEWHLNNSFSLSFHFYILTLQRECICESLLIHLCLDTHLHLQLGCPWGLSHLIGAALTTEMPPKMPVENLGIVLMQTTLVCFTIAR